MPYTVNTFDEHLDMVMVCHHLNPDVPEDVAFAESRVRAETIGAEDVLHDEGAISMMTSDAQAMGRQAEVICRTWQTASKMKAQRGPPPEDEGGTHDEADNVRVKRYLAKLHDQPGHLGGHRRVRRLPRTRKLADVVVWDPAFFGIKPAMTFKGGFPVYSEMGEANGSLMTCEPIKQRPRAGAAGKQNTASRCRSSARPPRTRTSARPTASTRPSSPSPAPGRRARTTCTTTTTVPTTSRSTRRPSRCGSTARSSPARTERGDIARPAVYAMTGRTSSLGATIWTYFHLPQEPCVLSGNTATRTINMKCIPKFPDVRRVLPGKHDRKSGSWGRR